MNQRLLEKGAIESIFRLFQRAHPHPKGELFYTNNYTLLVAVVLSAQATDKGVNKATPALFAKVDSPQKMLDLGEESLIDHVKTIGLFRNKARHIMKLSRQLVDDFDGEVPSSLASLMKLAGVGRKTANVVLNIAFDEPVIAVDTHVFRVSNRMGLVNGATPDEVEQGLYGIVPSWARLHCHHWLILHGRYICKARKPDCSHCIVSELCTWEEKNVS